MSISMQTMEKYGRFVLYSNSKNLPANRKKINSKSRAREFLSLITTVSADISQLAGFWFWKSVNQVFQNLPNVALQATSFL